MNLMALVSGGLYVSGTPTTDQWLSSCMSRGFLLDLPETTPAVDTEDYFLVSSLLEKAVGRVMRTVLWTRQSRQGRCD